MKKIILASYSFIAAFIGAGFASGQEIICYFVSFGRYGFIGVILSAFVFTVFSYAVMSVCRRLEINSFEDFLGTIPHRSVRRILKPSIGLFAFAVYTVMLSAIGSAGARFTPLPPSVCALMAAAGCTLLFCRGTKGVFDLNGVIGVLLTAGIAACCMYMLRYREYHVFSQELRAVSNAYIYSGYNLISLTPVMAVIGGSLDTKHSPAAVSLIAGSALFVMTALMFGILSVYARKIDLGELPMLTLSLRQNSVLGGIYAVLLCGAIMTTLLSSGGSVIETFGIGRRPLVISAVSAAAYLLSGIGFSRLVDTAYRICGIAGAALVTLITIYCIKNLINHQSKK